MQLQFLHHRIWSIGIRTEIWLQKQRKPDRIPISASKLSLLEMVSVQLLTLTTNAMSRIAVINGEISRGREAEASNSLSFLDIHYRHRQFRPWSKLLSVQRSWSKTRSSQYQFCRIRNSCTSETTHIRERSKTDEWCKIHAESSRYISTASYFSNYI